MAIKFADRQTKWEGLWYHPKEHNFTSAAFNLAALKEFKGTCRIRMFKNLYKTKGDNKPTYLFTIASTTVDPSDARLLEVVSADETPEYTYGEVRELLQRCIDECERMCRGGFYGDTFPEDFLGWE